MIRRKVVKKSVPLIPTQVPESLAEWERWIVGNAYRFSCVVKIGPGRVYTTWHSELAAAIAEKRRRDSSGDYKHPSMVYAATKGGRSTMLAESQYDEMLKLRSWET
jgi:DNA-binding PadR family transcriptional regulator